jgi:hypothetical protein
MLIREDNDGHIIGWAETYFSDNRTVRVNVSRNFTTISPQDRTTGQVKSETFIGKPPVPGVFEGRNSRR